MTIHAFEKEQERLLADPEIRAAWLEYLSRYPYQSVWFRSAGQFANQISIVNGKMAWTDVNLYKLFVEQCFTMLRDGGQCGIILPAGFYTDLGYIYPAQNSYRIVALLSSLRYLFGLSNESDSF